MHLILIDVVCTCIQSPPGQLTYSFIRGASKQHGTLMSSDVCTFTQWGHKVPGDPNPSPTCTSGNDHGPTCGTSYSAMKRMMYTLLMYDAAAAGLESYLFYPPAGNTTLSPMGVMLSSAKKWADNTPTQQRGVHLATTGLLMDYFAGTCTGTPESLALCARSTAFTIMHTNGAISCAPLLEETMLCMLTAPALLTVTAVASYLCHTYIRMGDAVL